MVGIPPHPSVCLDQAWCLAPISLTLCVRYNDCNKIQATTAYHRNTSVSMSHFVPHLSYNSLFFPSHSSFLHSSSPSLTSIRHSNYFFLCVYSPHLFVPSFSSFPRLMLTVSPTIGFLSVFLPTTQA